MTFLLTFQNDVSVYGLQNKKKLLAFSFLQPGRSEKEAVASCQTASGGETEATPDDAAFPWKQESDLFDTVGTTAG